MENLNNNQTIIEKYNPKELSELKLPVRISKLIEKNTSRIGYRLMFYGPPGVGKTTTALLMVKNKKTNDVLYLSGSNDFTVKTLREKVYPFCGNHSVLDKIKTVIIDEAENIKDKDQDAFKIILDKSKKVNFIFITNEIEKMNEAVLSRCTQVEYNYHGNEMIEQQNNYVQFLYDIITKENLKYDNSGIKELYIKNFPDIRHSLVTIQQLIDSELVINSYNVINAGEIGIQNIELYELIQNNIDSQKFYEESTKFKGKEKECFNSLSEPYFRYLNSNGKFEQTLKSSVIIAKYSNMLSNGTSKFGIFFACISELRLIFR